MKRSPVASTFPAGISVVAALAESGHPRGHWESDKHHAISKEKTHE